MTMPDLPDFETDAALNAELDGELDAFARDLGTDTASVRAGLAARPGIDERRHELLAVRAALGTPVPPLDDLSRARLLAGAVAQTDAEIDTLTPAPVTRFGRDRGWVVRAAAAAVVVLALAGGGVLIARTNSSSPAAKSTGGGGSAARTAARGDLGDLGELSRDQIDRLIGGPKSGVDVPSPLERSVAQDAANDSAKSADAHSSAAAPGPSTSYASSVAPDQLRACRAEYERLGGIQFEATGTYQAQPAVVLGIKRAERLIVFVVAAENCQRVLLSVSR
ncbi:MAG: hypothetical protein JJE46_10080 [Acidimicrobiia bacterium]|nr:hypothetical protein [Acidimicrobiia bacterium]